MRKKGKITAGISAVLLAALLGSVTVMADTAAPEPVVSIETDREEYSVGDPISETVKIYNASEETMTDIRIQGSIPEGYQTEEGVSGQWEAQIEKAEAGKILETGVKLIRKTTGEVPDGNNGEDPSDTGSRDRSRQQELRRPETEPRSSCGRQQPRQAYALSGRRSGRKKENVSCHFCSWRH